MNYRSALLLITFGLVIVAGCAGHNPLIGTPDASGQVAGLFMGFWHGSVVIIAFLASIFTDISIYEVHNTGFGYNFGFMLGAVFLPGGIFRLLF